MQIQGISTLLVAKNPGETAGVRGFPTAAHFASYAGASPRSSTAGPGRDYYARKISEGKTPGEARRALKRRLCNLIYRTVIQDARRSTLSSC